MNGPDHIRRKELHCAVALVATADWSIAEGSSVDQRQILGTIGAIELGNLQQLVSPARGTLRILTAEQVKTLLAHANGNQTKEDPTVPIAYVEYCIHPLMNGRTCMMCLAVVDENEDDLDDERRSVNVVSHGQMLRLNVEEAKKFDSANIKRQLDTKKLSLVLDLDHTLLHAVRVEDVNGGVIKTDDIHFFTIPGLPSQHVVKLRPGLSDFLEQLSLKYDLFIYTHGTRTYAEQIAKIIDPKGTFFQHRIVARTDTPDMLHKSLKLLFPSCDDSMILVLDDRIDVWKENEGNVFLIEPYHFFNTKAEINNASGSGVLGFEDDSAVDDHLEHAKRVLVDVHTAFYDQEEQSVAAVDQMAGKGRDVKRILTQHKKTVLAGCKLVFSGLFPLQGPRKPESHYLWKLAVELGATPSLSMENFEMTHLVIHPGRLDTQKHVQAKSMPNVKVVVPEWMLKSARIWKHASETEFLADEWKAKLAKQEADKKAAAEAAAVAARAPPPPPLAVTPTPAPAKGDESVDVATMDVDAETKSEEPVDGESLETKQSNGEHESTAAVTTASKPPPDSILVKESRVSTVSDDGTTSSKDKKKSVKFSAEVDAAEAQRAAEAKQELEQAATFVGVTVSASGQRRPMRRGVGPRPVPAARVPENKGIVASGGTFDFLSKISQLGASKRDHKPSASASASATASTRTAPVREPSKDMDDAFLRLIEAEEEESTQDQKRKRGTSDLKNQLASRRLKQAKTVAGVVETTAASRPAAKDEALFKKAIAEAAGSYSASVINDDGDVDTSKPEEDDDKVMVVDKSDDSDDAEDGLDDLEADILDAL